MNSFYSGMLNGLSKVKMGDFERAQAELRMRRAAALVEMVMGSRPVVSSATVEAPAVAEKAEEYRQAA